MEPNIRFKPGALTGVRLAIEARTWAILEDKLDAILEVVDLHAAGHRPTSEEIAARVGSPKRPALTRAAGGRVAILPVYGVIAQRMNMMSEMSGGTSTELLGKQFQQLVDDADIGAIVLDVDSPGGTVEGVPELAAQIFAARGKKPVVAVANSLMASAAYWLASAADEVVITEMGLAGSIGAYRVHTDLSEAAAKAGVRHTMIKAGKHKAEGYPYEPLSAEAEAAMQEDVTVAYDSFVAAVARHRGTTEAAVRSGYGEGRVLRGERAVAAGLADRVGTLDDVVAELAGSVPSSSSSRRVAAAAPRPPIGAAGVAAAALTASTQLAVDEAAAVSAGSPLVLTTAPVAKEHTVPDQTTAAANGAAPIAVAERADRGAEIAELCALADVPHLAVNYIRSGKSVADVKTELFESRRAQAAAPAVPPAPSIEDYESGKRRFNVATAIQAAIGNDWRDAGFEREVSNDLQKRIKGGDIKGVRGTTFYMPTMRRLSEQERDARMQAAAHVAGTPSVGGNLVFTEYGGFIDLLRSRMVLASLGATFYPGLQGNVAFPRQSAAGTAYWVAEGVGGTDVTESNMTFDQVVLSPKTVMARQRYSNQLLAQGVINADAKIRQDLAAILGRGIDKSGLHGAGGTANDPLGLYGITGVNEVTFGGGITYAKVVEMESAIEGDDADIGTMAYVTTPEIKGKAKVTPQFTSEGVPVWSGSAVDGEVNGYRAMASNQVSKVLTSGTETGQHGILYGVWSSLLIGDWGGMAITVDPYTLAGQDQVRIIARHFVDVDVDHPEAFCRGIGLANA